MTVSWLPQWSRHQTGPRLTRRGSRLSRLLATRKGTYKKHARAIMLPGKTRTRRVRGTGMQVGSNAAPELPGRAPPATGTRPK